MQYALITAARNEARNLEETIESVLRQDMPPVAWIIIDDGSTDATGEIMRRAAARAPFIHTMSTGAERRPGSFASKATAFMQAWGVLRLQDFDCVGNLDADITLSHDFYRRLIERMEKQPLLGIASGVYWDYADGRVVRRNEVPPMHTPGAMQLFRRDCFEAIGGYQRLRYGGIDTAACTTARRLGWLTRSFSDLVVLHRGVWGSRRGRGALQIRYRHGKMDYHLGMHPLYAALKAVRRAGQSPMLIGSLCYLAGYGASLLTREKREVGGPDTRFIQYEQLAALRAGLARRLNPLLRRSRPGRAPEPEPDWPFNLVKHAMKDKTQ